MRIGTVIAFVLGCAVLLFGCRIYIPVDIDAASRPVPDLDAIEVVGTAMGESCSQYFLGIPLFSEPPVYNAYARARSANEGADSLINVTVDSDVTSVLGPLYVNACVTVRGDAIRYLR